MSPDDLIYPFVADVPLCLMVHRADGAYFDWQAGKYWTAGTAFDVTRHSLRMAPGKVFPSSQQATIPAAAVDPTAVLEVADASGKVPVVMHSHWLALAMASSPNQAATTADHLVVSGPTTTGVGRPIGFIVQACDASGQLFAPYQGTVHFTSTDPAAILPPDYIFTSVDGGRRTFFATFKAAGVHSITASDAARPKIAGAMQAKVSP